MVSVTPYKVQYVHTFPSFNTVYVSNTLMLKGDAAKSKDIKQFDVSSVIIDTLKQKIISWENMSKKEKQIFFWLGDCIILWSHGFFGELL